MYFVCQKLRLGPGPSYEWQLWLGPALKKAKAPAFGPSRAGTSLAMNHINQLKRAAMKPLTNGPNDTSCNHHCKVGVEVGGGHHCHSM